MKRFLALAALVLGMVSCQTEPEGLDVNVGGEQDVNITVSLPEGTRANSALGAFENVDMTQYDIRYIFQVFDAKGENAKEKQVIYSDAHSVSFPVRLIPGRSYNFVVWADLVKNGDKENAHYIIGETLKEISINKWAPMDETRDAYTCSELLTFSRTNGINKTLELKRPFAKLRVITTDMLELMGVKPTWAKVVYTTPYYRRFNAYDQKPYDLSSTGKDHSELFDIAPYDYEVGDAEKTLFTDYFFAINPENGQAPETVAFTMEVFDEGGATIDEVKKFNTSIPVKRNYLTTIKGNILTYGDNITVEVKPEFENGGAWNPETDDCDVELWDGVTIEEPAYDAATKTYSIRNGNHLAWVAAAVNGTLPADTRATIEPKSFKGETIKLVKDINLNFENWTPIGIPTGYNNLFNGTFDGDGHKVANLHVDNNKGAGLFGATTGATIKNVVIDNVRLNTNHYAGAVVAWAESGAVAVKLENCVVKNAEVTVKAELVNGEWDNGDKGAALIGYAHAVNIANCKVENVKVTAYRDFAGLVGYADKTSITECETANVELVQDLTYDYKDETPNTYGEVIGRNGGGNKIDGDDFVSTAQQLQAAVDAATGDVTIRFGNDIEGDVTVVQKPGVKITINGRGFKYNGSIKVHSNSNHYADAALTIKNVNFETTTASVNFVEALENGSQRYSTNITVEECTFTATGEAVNTAVGLQIKSSKWAKAEKCTANGLHSLVQAQSCDETVVVKDCTINGKNGVAFKQVKDATVEDTNITALEYGIRFDGNTDNYGIVVKNNNVTAYQPLIVRKMTGKNNTIALEGENTLTTEEAYQIVITNGSDDEAYVKPTGTYELTGADNYTVFPAPFPVASWDEFTAALAAGETDIKLTDNIEYSANYQLQKSVILDLGGYSMTLPMINIHTMTTIKNGTINGKVYARKNSEIVFNNVKFSGAVADNLSTEGHLAIQGGCKSLYAKDCLFSPTSVSGSQTKPLSFEGGSTIMKFENCEFKSSPYKKNVYFNSLSATAKLDFTNCNFNNKTPNIMFAAACPLTNLTMSGTTKLSSVTLETNRAKDAVTAEDLAYLRESLIANNSMSSVRLFYAGGSSEYIR